MTVSQRGIIADVQRVWGAIAWHCRRFGGTLFDNIPFMGIFLL